MKLSLPAILLSFFLTSCATGPTPIQREYAKDLPPMHQEECEELARMVIEDRLKDPESARFQFGKCRPAWLKSVPIMGMGAQYGHYIEGKVNAKNSYGGYTGFTNFYVLMEPAAALRAAMADREGLMIPWRP